jgi:hypothetical protein
LQRDGIEVCQESALEAHLLPERKAEQHDAAEYGECDEKSLPQMQAHTKTANDVADTIGRLQRRRNRRHPISDISPQCLRLFCAIAA